MEHERKTAKAYLTVEQYERWKTAADEMDMSVSGFIASMTEAGLKKFDASVEPDQTNADLRSELEHHKQALSNCRDDLVDCEERLDNTTEKALEQYVTENPGANFRMITDHLRDTVPVRAAEILDGMEGDELERNENNLYYPRGASEAEQ